MNVDSKVFEEAIEPPVKRAKIALERYRQSLTGRKAFLFPDSQLEIPLARFLSRECGMELVEVGMPYIDRLLMDKEIALLPEGTVLSEGQGVHLLQSFHGLRFVVVERDLPQLPELRKVY